jgi:hypothetical protein
MIGRGRIGRGSQCSTPSAMAPTRFVVHRKAPKCLKRKLRSHGPLDQAAGCGSARKKPEETAICRPVAAKLVHDLQQTSSHLYSLLSLSQERKSQPQISRRIPDFWAISSMCPASVNLAVSSHEMELIEFRGSWLEMIIEGSKIGIKTLNATEDWVAGGPSKGSSSCGRTILSHTRLDIEPHIFDIYSLMNSPGNTLLLCFSVFHNSSLIVVTEYRV